MHLNSIRLRVDEYPTDAQYPFNQPLLRETTAIAFTTPITFFVGENGAGKSTLLEAISRCCGIHIWRAQEMLRVGRNPYEDRLHRYLDIEWADGPVPGSFFGSDIFKHFARSLEEWASVDPGLLNDFGGHSLLTQSHGQSLMAFFRSRYRIRGLYLLDEPETALSPGTQIELVHLLGAMAAAGHAQFIIASHSPILLACPGAHLLTFDQSPVTEVRYEDTSHYRVYHEFMADPEGFLQGHPASSKD